MITRDGDVDTERPRGFENDLAGLAREPQRQKRSNSAAYRHIRVPILAENKPPERPDIAEVSEYLSELIFASPPPVRACLPSPRPPHASCISIQHYYRPTVHPELSQWHAKLNCRRDLMSHPEEHRQALTDGAKALLARDVITPDEWLELCDLITGAYSFAMEQRAYELFHQASSYEVFDSDWKKVGTASRSVLLFTGADWPLLIRYVDDGQLQAFGDTGFTHFAGSLKGLVLTMENGRRFTLVEVGRYLRGGKHVKAISDPDSFRLVLLAIEAAREDGDIAKARHLYQRAQVNPYRICPMCRDRFDSRDHCPRCAGLGFIRRIWGCADGT